MRRATRKSLTGRCSSALAASIALIALVGCDRLATSKPDPGLTLTPTKVRAARRLYDGAPPVIPHSPLNIACTDCHNATGREAPPIGFAPANPHARTQGIGGTRYCQQCHVFRQGEDLFHENDFRGLAQRAFKADRLYPGAPPVVPHRVFMHENCAACHSGPSARPEIVCRHIERTNCRQCHVPVRGADERPLLTALESSATAN